MGRGKKSTWMPAVAGMTPEKRRSAQKRLKNPHRHSKTTLKFISHAPITFHEAAGIPSGNRSAGPKSEPLKRL